MMDHILSNVIKEMTRLGMKVASASMKYIGV